MKILLILCLLTSFSSCAQNVEKKDRDPRVSKLSNNIIPLLKYIDDPDSCLKALSYLDSATAIDSNCFLCFQNKIMFLNSLKKYDQIIIANNNLIRIAPHANDLYLTGGILYKKIGDNKRSEEYFQKSLSICNSILDTMNRRNRDYVLITMNKATNLKMLGDEKQAYEILKVLYDSEPDDLEWDNMIKKEILALMNNSKGHIIEEFFNPKSNSR